MVNKINNIPDAEPSLSSAVPTQAAMARSDTGLKRSQIVALGALIIGFAALSHYSSTTPEAKGLGAALSIGPVLLIAMVLVWRWTRPWIAVAIAACVGTFFYRYWGFFERNYEIADLVEQCGAYALIGLSFARSLFAGRVPLVTQLAKELHGTLVPAEIVYTRRATLAWAAFYMVLAAAILILFFYVSQSTWSFFVNFATFGLIIAAVLVDFTIRRAVLPQRPGNGLLTMLRRSLIG